MEGDWATRADAIKQRRLAAGLPVQIGKGEHQTVNPVTPVFDYERDTIDHPFRWLPDKPEDLYRLPEPLRTWALKAHQKEQQAHPVIHLKDKHDKRAEAVRLYNQTSMGVTDIARQLGIPKQTVQRWVQQGKKAALVARGA
jgi:predicted DNA-binding protein (UPF0251 family)